MAFINDMKERLSQAGQTAIRKTADLSELAKLNSTISNAEKQISELYGKIGYEVYCAYCDAPLPEVTELIAEVTALHKSIEDCKAQIEAINSANTCPECGAKISKGMAFCSECGFKLPEKGTPDTKQFAVCSHCGAPISANSAFCASCGHKNSVSPN